MTDRNPFIRLTRPSEPRSVEERFIVPQPPEYRPPVHQCLRCFAGIGEADFRINPTFCPDHRPPDLAGMDRRIRSLEAEVARLGQLLNESPNHD